MFRPITLKQLNSLTSTDKFSCLGGLEVTLPTAVQEVPGSGKYFYFCYLCFVVVVFPFPPKNILIGHAIFQIPLPCEFI